MLFKQRENENAKYRWLFFVDEKKSHSFDKTSSLVKDLATVIFTAQIGLVGTALGFYFGSKNSAD